MKKTQKEIQKIVEDLTCRHGVDFLKAMSTGNIAKTLNISRSLASQYLNELCKQGQCIKINSRPVYYFDRTQLEKKYNVTLTYNEYYNMPDLIEALKQKQKEPQDFFNAVGGEGSLSYCISQLKAAMLYPHGLPVILQGEKGSGKTFLARLAFEFLKNQDRVTDKACFIAYQFNSEQTSDKMLEDIFGIHSSVKKQTGFIEKCQNGLLYLSQADKMSLECQQRIADYINTGQFTRMGDSDHPISSQMRIIIGMDTPSLECLGQDLRLSIPVHCSIPPLMKRPAEEREQLVRVLLNQEQKRLNCEIRLSQSLFTLLGSNTLGLNIHELKNCIRTMCANAFLEQEKTQSLNLKRVYLPEPLLSKIPLEWKGLKEEFVYLTINELVPENDHHQIFDLFDLLLEAHRDYFFNHHHFNSFLKDGLEIMRKYYDMIVFEQKEENPRISSIENMIQMLIDQTKDNSRLTLPLNCSFVLARIIYSLNQMNTSASVWESEQKDSIQSCLNSLKQELPQAFSLADELISRLCATLEIKTQPLNIIFLTLNICFYNQQEKGRQLCGIIISHGYSTASSIADAANQLLQSQVFDAIDMPLDTEVAAIEKQLDMFLQMHSYYQGMLVLVDMGSLEAMAQHLNSKMDIGIINNISTGLALDVGNRIKQNEELETILVAACQSHQCHYRLLRQTEKPKAIIFTNDISIRVSGKLAELFRSSLPRPVNIKFIEVEYSRLKTTLENDDCFQQYHVVLLIKPLGSKLEGVNSVTLEDIVGFRNLQPLSEAFQDELNDEELDQFHQQLLKNFSLQSLMENLTILNPSPLLDSVYEAVSELQRQRHCRFQSRTLVGIYIHVSFLIERLVTRTAIESQADLTRFQKEHQDFIDQVHISFQRILKSYNVTVPIDEISYLYDYIANDEAFNKKDLEGEAE